MSLFHRSALLTLVLAAAAAAPAHAAKPPKLPHFSFRFYKVTAVTGTERLDFAGDPATCQAHGVCDTAGTETYTPALGKLSLADYVSAGSLLQEGQILLGAGATTASVATAGAQAPCTDTVAVHGATATLERQGSQIRAILHGESSTSGLSLGGNDGVFATHCAGPRAPDLTTALPSGGFNVAKLNQRTLAIDLRADNAPFTAAGFAGHLTSDIRVKLRRDKASEKLIGSITDQIAPKGGARS
jgi:hypothetical protein